MLSTGLCFISKSAGILVSLPSLALKYRLSWRRQSCQMRPILRSAHLAALTAAQTLPSKNPWSALLPAWAPLITSTYKQLGAHCGQRFVRAPKRPIRWYSAMPAYAPACKLARGVIMSSSFWFEYIKCCFPCCFDCHRAFSTLFSLQATDLMQQQQQQQQRYPQLWLGQNHPLRGHPAVENHYDHHQAGQQLQPNNPGPKAHFRPWDYSDKNNSKEDQHESSAIAAHDILADRHLVLLHNEMPGGQAHHNTDHGQIWRISPSGFEGHPNNKQAPPELQKAWKTHQQVSNCSDPCLFLMPG